MKSFLQKHWKKVVVGLVILALFWIGTKACRSYYSTQQAKLSGRISDLEKSEKAAVSMAGKEHAEAVEWKAKADKEAIRGDRAVADAAAFRRQRDEAITKNKNITPTQVTAQTITYVGCSNIFERKDGILFSFDCGKANLEILVKESYQKGEIDSLNTVIVSRDTEIGERKLAYSNLEGAYDNLGLALKDCQASKVFWGDKFNLSESRNRASWWNGLKWGVPTGVTVTVLFIKYVVPLLKK